MAASYNIADYRGMNPDTGREIAGLAHLKLALKTVLTTPLRARVMRRNFGSDLFSLTDSQIDGAGLARFYAASAAAIDAFEPRISLARVAVASNATDIKSGHLVLALEGEQVQTREPLAIDRLVLNADGDLS